MNKILLMLAAIALFFGCNCLKKENQNIIGKPTVEVKDGNLSPEVLWGMGKIGESALSPDGKTIAFTLTYYSITENKGNAEIYLIDVDGTNQRQITFSQKSEFNIQWTKDNDILFLRNTEKGPQIFKIKSDGKKEKQISFFEKGLEGFKLSADNSTVLFIQTIDKQKEMANLYEGLDKSSGRINEGLMYRHWDEWVDAYPHIFLANYNGVSVDITSNVVDLLEGELFECPMRPWGGIEQFNFSPDGKTIAYTCRKKTGKEYAISTNSDVFVYDIATKSTKNLTEEKNGYDQNPVFSNNGKLLAWQSMERDGYEADKIRLMVYNFENNTTTDVSKDFDQNAENIAFDKTDENIYFISPYLGTEEVFVYNFQNNNFKRITNGIHNITSFILNDNQIIAQQQSMQYPTEIFSYQIDNGEEKQLTFNNKDVLDKLTLGEVKSRWIKTSDNKEMLTWIIYPPNFDPNKKYPALLYCQGGPQSMVSQFWSTRWNFQIMAAAGYIVVAPNRHGVPGFGQAWNEQISGDYGGQNMRDYLAAIDHVAKESYVDETKLGACGASYGGFSVFWLAGNHNNRFSAFLAHNGMFNLEQQYLETEEMWFVDWDLGGAYWDKNNKVAQNSYANSPHKFVDKWTAPLCVIHSELDYRIVASQGMAAYNAAQLRDVPSRYLYFPDENHWVLQPQNSILWHRNFIDWFDKWLK